LLAAMLRALPLLAPKEKSLELCVYCPKLCRAACPVSNVTAKETLIPWGKMSTAYFLARGDVPRDASHSETAWACTSCHACTERCDHHNDVAGTLSDVRAALFEAGSAPPSAKRIAAQFAGHQKRTKKAIARLAKELPEHVSNRGTPMLVGCTYARALPSEARDLVVAASKLAGGPVRLVDACCGQPLRHAGDAAQFDRAALEVSAQLGEHGHLLVGDPGCAVTLSRDYAERLGTTRAKPRTVVELAAMNLADLTTTPTEERVRYHDSCQLGRGLGLFDEPRAILRRVLGRAPEEFEEKERMAACSGGGGMLPASMPETSRAIARARIEDGRARGGGEIVTGCASSLLTFRRAGARASDLGTWIARALPR
jgi:Fe-S oxidoreductase